MTTSDTSHVNDTNVVGVDESQHTETVVVGVDRTAGSAAAVRWAAAEAARRGARLHAVHVVNVHNRHDAGLGADWRLELAEARQTVPGRVAGSIFGEGIEVDLSVAVICGDVAAQLAHQARGACLVVIGAPDGPFQRTLPSTLVSHCLCQVAVVDVDGDVELPEPAPQHLEGAHHVRT